MEEAGQGIPCAGHFLRRAKRLTFSADIKKADHIGLLFKIWWVVQGSNLRPSPCKGDALPAELTTHFSFLKRGRASCGTPGVTARYSKQLNNRSASSQPCRITTLL